MATPQSISPAARRPAGAAPATSSRSRRALSRARR
jgi:hypothetical protein